MITALLYFSSFLDKYILLNLHISCDLRVMKCNFPIYLNFLGAVTSQVISTEEEQEVNVLDYLLHTLNRAQLELR
jgi:hypothetical protein